MKYRISLDELDSNGTAWARHDLEVFGVADGLDYWGRGVIEISGDQAAYLNSQYGDNGIVSPATGSEHLVRAFKSNDSWQWS